MRGAGSVRTSLAAALLGALAACARDPVSPPLLVRLLPAEYFLIGYAEAHDSLRDFRAECVVAGIVGFDRGTLEAATGLSLVTSYLRRSLGGALDSLGTSAYGSVRLAWDPHRSSGGVRLEMPAHGVVPAVLEGTVERDSTYRGPWPCTTATVPGTSAAPGDTTFALAGRWALCPDSARCSLSPPGGGGGPPPVHFEFPSLPRVR
jgi:hypothetical protein